MAKMKFEPTTPVEEVPELIQHTGSASDCCCDCRTGDAHFGKWTEAEEQAGVKDDIQAIGEPQRSKGDGRIARTAKRRVQ